MSAVDGSKLSTFAAMEASQLQGKYKENGVPSETYLSPHSGAMVCACGHDMGSLAWPLVKGINHLNGRCNWTCCQQSWDATICSSSDTKYVVKAAASSSSSKGSSSKSSGSVLPPPDVSTELSTPARVGDKRLQVLSSTGFEAGMRLNIGSGASMEKSICAGLGSILLDKPLLFPHASGETVQGFVAPREKEEKNGEEDLTVVKPLAVRAKIDHSSLDELLASMPTKLIGKEAEEAEEAEREKERQIEAKKAAEAEAAEAARLALISEEEEKISERTTLEAIDPRPAAVSFFGAIGSSFSSIGGLLTDMFVFVPLPVELEEIIRTLFEEIPVTKRRLLLHRAALIYLKLLGISEKHTEMIKEWIDQSVNAWKKLFGLGKFFITEANTASGGRKEDKPASSKDKKIKATTFLLSLLAELESPYPFGTEHGRLGVKGLKARVSTDGLEMLLCHAFVDWYVVFRYTNLSFVVPELSSFPLLTERHSSAMAAVLRKQKELFAKLRDLKTHTHFSFDNVIQPGIDQPALLVGCCAGDEEAYELFRPFYIAVINELGLLPTRYVPEGTAAAAAAAAALGAASTTGFKYVTDLNVKHIDGASDIDESFVYFSSVQCSRNLTGLSMPIHSSRAGRRKAEDLIISALESLEEEEFEGTYSYLFQLEDQPVAQKPAVGSMLASAWGTRDWPFGRGIFKSNDGCLEVRVNFEDHLLITVKQEATDIISVFKRFCRATLAIMAALKEEGLGGGADSPDNVFMLDEELGFLTSCPSNVGTGMEATIALKLENLGKPLYGIHALCEKMGLECHPTQEGLSCISWNISCRYRIGCTEVEALQVLVDGAKMLIEMEKKLVARNGEAFASLVNSLPQKYIMPAIVSNDAAPSASGGGGDAVPSAGSATNAALAENGTLKKRVYVRIPVDASEDFPILTPLHTSLMAKHITRELYSQLRHFTLHAEGWSIAQAIRCGVDIPSTPVGIAMGSIESYEYFKFLLRPMLLDLHGFDATDMKMGEEKTYHATDMEEVLDNVTNLDELEEFLNLHPELLSHFSIDVSRNITGYPFAPAMNRQQRRLMEHLLYTAFNGLSNIPSPTPDEPDKPNELAEAIKGKYTPLFQFANEDVKILRDEGRYFDKPALDSLSYVSGISRDFPDGRGLFLSSSGLVYARVNEDDHVRFFVTGDVNEDSCVKGALVHLTALLSQFEKSLFAGGHCFVHSERIGFLTSFLDILGTAMRINFTLSLPALTQLVSKLEIEQLSASLNYVASKGEGRSDDEKSLWSFRSTKTLGISEAESVQAAVEVVLHFGKLEQQAMRELQRRAVSDRALDVVMRQNSRKSFNQVISSLPIVHEEGLDSDEEQQQENARASSKAKAMPLSVEEVVYAQICRNKSTGVFDVPAGRPPLPSMTYDKALERFKLSSDSPLQGVMLFKKTGTESRQAFKENLLWVDPITSTLHWCTTDIKESAHKALNLNLARTIRSQHKPELYVHVVTEEGESIDFYFSTSIERSVEEDWLKILRILGGERFLESRPATPVKGAR